MNSEAIGHIRSQYANGANPTGYFRASVSPRGATELLPGVQWGELDSHGSPAERLDSILYARSGNTMRPISPECTLSQSLGRHICAGVAYHELGMAAYTRLDALGAFGRAPPSAEQISRWLAKPFELGQGGEAQPTHLNLRQITDLADCLLAISRAAPFTDVGELREWLAVLPSLDRCAASWIVRFAVESERIVPIDQYVLENGQLVGLFPLTAQLERDYLALEDRFLQFCDRMQVAAWELQAQYVMDLDFQIQAIHQRVQTMKSALS